MRYSNYLIFDYENESTCFFGDVETAGSRISDVKKKNTNSFPKGLIFPGLVNIHVHLGELPFRGHFLNTTLDEYLGETEKLNGRWDLEKFRYQFSLLSLGEMLINGTTVIAGGRLRPAVDFFQMEGFSFVPLMDSKKLKKYLLNLPESVDGSDGVFVHSIRKIPEESLIVLAELMKKSPRRLMIHVSETIEDVKFCHNKYGISEIQLLKKMNLLNQDTILVHCSHCTKVDTNLIKSAKSTIVICPTSNMRLGGKLLDIREIYKDINICVSTDGPGTNDSLDLFSEVKSLFLAQKIPPIELLKMMTINPAKALGSCSGEIKVGKDANLIVFDIDTHFYPFKRLENILVLNPPTRKIRDVLSGGRRIVERGTLVDKYKNQLIVINKDLQKVEDGN